MCCRGVAAAVLPHLSLLLVLWSGLALSWGAWYSETHAAVLAAPPELELALSVLVLLPLAAAPLALLLAHLAVAAVRTAPHKTLLITYAMLGLVLSCAYGGAATWSMADLARWVQSERARSLVHNEHTLRAWLRPLILLAEPQLLDAHPSESTVSTVAGAWAGLVVFAPLQLLAAVLALCALPHTNKMPRSSLRRSSSVYYESTLPVHKLPPGHPHEAHYQPHPRAPLDQHAPWL